MASLIQELIDTLETETAIYEELIPITKSKTQKIINNDLLALQDVTEQEQHIIEKINALEHKREEVVLNIGTVISRDPKGLNIKMIIAFLEKQPEEQKKLNEVHSRLKQTIQILMEINSHNKSLIKQSLELIEFNMNLVQSTRMSPGSGNYNKGASTIENMGIDPGMFDAKQ